MLKNRFFQAVVERPRRNALLSFVLYIGLAVFLKVVGGSVGEGSKHQQSPDSAGSPRRRSTLLRLLLPESRTAHLRHRHSAGHLYWMLPAGQELKLKHESQRHSRRARKIAWHGKVEPEGNKAVSDLCVETGQCSREHALRLHSANTGVIEQAIRTVMPLTTQHLAFPRWDASLAV